MGGLASVLGGAALGFSQAAQQDRERQFQSEENRRSQIGTWLGKLAGDETAHPASRQAAIQEMLALQQAPFGKPYKFDIDKIIAPAEPPSTQTSVTGRGDVAGAQHQLSVPTPPGGMIGPQQDTAATVQGQGHPTLPLTAELTKPGVPAGVFMSPEEVTQLHAARAGATTSAQLGAQYDARKQTLAGIELPPDEKAMLTLGVPGYSTMATRSVGSGGGFAGDLRKMGYVVPDDIPDEQYVSMKQTALGKNTFTPDKLPPSYTVDTEGKAIPRMAADVQKEQRQLGNWGKKNAVQFQQRLALQQTALQNALSKGDYQSAKKIVMSSKGDVDAAIDRMTTMDKNLIAAKHGDQQAMLSLVANHIGMTLGAQKGARITRAVWDEAMQSAPWLQRVGARFDSRGLLQGVTLSPEQMDQMVGLAHEKVGILNEHVTRVGDEYQKELEAKAGPKIMPPKQPSGVQPAPKDNDPLGLRK